MTNISSDWKSRWKSPLLAAVLFSVLPYLFSINFSFVYDDHGFIVENPFLVQHGAWAKVLTLRTFFDPAIFDGQRPLVLFSYLLDHAVWGFKPFGFHLTNIVLHAACVALVYSLCSALLRRSATAGAARLSRFFPFAAAVIFGLHPVLTEAVQCPANRKEMLAAVFVLGFLRLAIARRWIAALMALFLALCGKETAVVAPVLLVWLWICFPRKSDAGIPARASFFSAGRDARATIYLLAGSVALVAIYLFVGFTHRPMQAAGGIGNGLSLRWPANISTAPWIFVRWLKTLFVPFPLCADYVVKPAGFFSTRFAAGFAALTVAAAAAIYLRRRAPPAAFGLGWLLTAFLPVSNLIPLFNPMADRYLYFPAIGFAMVVGFLICGRKKTTTDNTDSTDRTGCSTSVKSVVHSAPRAAVLAGICAIYFGLTSLRLTDWRSDETLWKATAKTEPRSARAQTWLGYIASSRGDLAEARMRYEAAFDLNPHDVHPLINMAVLDARAGDLPEAEKEFRRAVTIRPDMADGWWNLALTLHAEHRDAGANAAVREARKVNPYDPRWSSSGSRQP